MGFWLLLFLICGCLGAFDRSFRLVPRWKPTAYHVKLYIPRSEQDDVPMSTVSITLECLKNETDVIILHGTKSASADFLDCDLKNTTRVDGTLINKTQFDENTTSLTVTLPRHFNSGDKCKLHLKHKLNLGGRMKGALELNSNANFVLITQLQYLYARNLFPSMDEPAYKAKFTISILVPESYPINTTKFISNMPHKKPESMPIQTGTGNQTKYLKVDFRETRPLSTHMINILIAADYEKSGSSTEESPQVTVWGRGMDDDFLAEFIRKEIGFAQTLFGLQFPEQYVQFAFLNSNPKEVGPSMKRWRLVSNDFFTGLSVIYHEIYDEFFGKRVTCEWWNEVWLNEGLTSFYTLRAVAEWKNLEDHGQLAPFLGLHSSLFTSLALVDHAYYPASDGKWPHTYKYGPLVLATVEAVLGKAAFHEAVKRYLSRHKHATATSLDFITSLQEVANEFKLRGWEDDKILQVEFFVEALVYLQHSPVVNVKWDGARKSFQLSRDTTISSFTVDFYLPVSYRLKSKPTKTKTYWLKPWRNLSIPLDNDSPDFTDVLWGLPGGAVAYRLTDNEPQVADHALNVALHERFHAHNDAIKDVKTVCIACSEMRDKGHAIVDEFCGQHFPNKTQNCASKIVDHPVYLKKI